MYKTYPKVLQLPITIKCNSRCVMCNIWKMDSSYDYNASIFSKIISDPIFKKVESVGINGGEPSLLKDIDKFIEAILNLPSLKSINIISHGFNQKKLLNICKQVFQMARDKNIKFHISISLDGVNKIHDRVRGINGVFSKTIKTIDEIIKNKYLYCDSFDIGCTIVNQNIDYLIELDTYAKIKNYPIKYRLGIENKRIESDKLVDNYSVKYTKDQQSAKEFFYYKMHDSIQFNDKFKYFSIFYWLKNNPKQRLMGCHWKEEGITLDSIGNLYYCAVESKKIGDIKINSGEDIFFNNDNLKYRQEIIDSKCDNCIHDYSGPITDENKLTFYEYEANKKIAMDIYKIKASLL